MSAEIYLDHAATSWPKPPGVLEAIEEFFANAGGNTGRSGHHRSIASSRVVSLAREGLADLLGAETPDSLIFTKNATEALNVAIHGLVEDGARVVTTSLEHNSVMRPLRHLESAGRISLEIVHVDGTAGTVDLAEWEARLRARPPCVAIATQASNVTGVILPVGELAAIASRHGVAFVVDASQSAGHLPLELATLGASAVAIPGHKGLLGPMGTGLLYLADGIEIDPLMRGGTGSLSELEVQPEFPPDRYESGTVNAVGIAGLGAAAAYLRGVGIDEVARRGCALGGQLRAGLAGIPNLTCYCTADPADAVGIVSVVIDGVPCATVARLLDDEWGIMTRAGLHCAPAAHRSLHTAPEGTLRISWGVETTAAEIDTTIEALRTIAVGGRSNALSGAHA